jgi:2,6-dihydroxypseudooxynicotine hydrolase
MTSVPAYPPATKFFDNGMDRFLADGGHYRELLKAREQITDWESWPGTWTALAHETERRGEQALKAGRKVTAAGEFSRAAVYFHFAQYLLHHDLVLKKELHDEKNRVFMRGAHLLRNPVEKVSFPFRGIEVTAYLRRPAGVSNPPVAICIGGADTTKEDYLTFSDLCMERGLATFAFDGPGQGDTFFKMKMIPDFEACIIAAIDYLETREEIDARRIGIVGRSLGGYLAPKAAAVEPRIKALACWGVKYDAKDLPRRSGVVLTTMLTMAGCETLEEGIEFYKFMDLAGQVENIKCPTFVTHGGRDQMPIAGAYRFIDELPNKPEVMIWDDSIHCCHDRSHIMRPAMADFLVEKL